MSRTIYWCPTCGMVWVADDAPLCRHNVLNGPPLKEMEPLPTWHPFATDPKAAA